MRLLLVDDDDDVTSTIETFLVRRGHRVDTAATAEEALLRAVEDAPDAIVTDLRLPGMSGVEMVRSMREHSTLRHLVVLALSGWSSAEHRARSLEAGFDEYLEKPVAALELESAVLRAIDRRRGR